MAAGICACRSGAIYRASRFPSPNSASARRVASSPDVPPATKFAPAVLEMLRELFDDLVLAAWRKTQR